MAESQLGKFKIEVTIHAQRVGDHAIATEVQTSVTVIENNNGEDLHKYERPVDVPNDEDRDFIRYAISVNDALNDFIRVALGGSATPRIAGMMKAIVKDIESGKINIEKRMEKRDEPDVPDSILNSPTDLEDFLRDNRDNIDFDEIPDEFKKLFRGLGLDA